MFQSPFMWCLMLTSVCRFMAASKVLGEESVKEQAQQPGAGQK